MSIKTYEITHFDFSRLQRVIDGYIEAASIVEAKAILWDQIRSEHEHYATCQSGRRNELHLTGGTKFTLTRIV